MESESLPLLGSAPAYDLRRPAGSGETALRLVDEPALARVEARLIKGLRGVGAAILHDIAIPATGTTVDHLCITPAGITAIDVERDCDGEGRDYLIERVQRESQVVAAALTDALVGTDNVFAAVCRSCRPEPLRPIAAGDVVIGGPRSLARMARRGHAGDKIDVQLALAVARNQFGHEHQRALRLSKPDGFLAYL